MSDLLANGVQLPNLSSGQGNQATSGYMRVYVKNNQLYGVDDQNNETLLSGSQYKVFHATVQTNSQGEWSVNYNGQFSQILSITTTAVNNSTDVSEQAISCVRSFNINQANGSVVEASNNFIILIGGGDGLEYVGAGIDVMIRVEGIE